MEYDCLATQSIATEPTVCPGLLPWRVLFLEAKAGEDCHPGTAWRPLSSASLRLTRGTYRAHMTVPRQDVYSPVSCGPLPGCVCTLARSGPSRARHRQSEARLEDTIFLATSRQVWQHSSQYRIRRLQFDHISGGVDFTDPHQSFCWKT